MQRIRDVIRNCVSEEVEYAVTISAEMDQALETMSFDTSANVGVEELLDGVNNDIFSRYGEFTVHVKTREWSVDFNFNR